MDKKKEKKGYAFASIRTRIVGMAIGGILAALCITYISIVPGAKSSLTDSIENNMLDLAGSYIKILNNSIEAVNETVVYMESKPDVYNCLMHVTEESSLAQAELNQYLRDNSSYTQADFYDLDGQFITSSNEDMADVQTPYYVNAVLSTGLPAQSDIITDGVDKPSIICAVPLTNSGSMYGVICVTVPADVLTADFGAIKLQGIESSFAYLISPQGYFIYHPDSAVIGKITGNDLLRGFLEQGNVASAIGRFRFDGSDKVVGLATSASNNWMLVIQANESEVLEPINRLTVISLLVVLVVLVVLAAVVYALSVSITKPIKILTENINNIANLDFREDEKTVRLGRRRDETGDMSRALSLMWENIRGIIKKINVVSENIGTSNTSLHDIASSLNDCASDNSAVSEQLAAGMQETSASVADINSRIEYIREMMEKVTAQSENTIELSNDIMQRADQAKDTTSHAADNTKKLYYEVSEEAKKALEQSKAVNRINDLTKNIMEIADQTSLLALNASIEAARSGEHGKGFAVVANEISHLATQSTDTVQHIIEIVDDVTEAVRHIDQCLSRTLTFLETSVMKDYDGFIGVSGEYHSDAQTFSVTIQDICGSIEELGNATNLIAQAIADINTNITESSEGISGIAGRATDVVSLSGETYDKVEDNTKMVHMLDDIVQEFTLE